MLLAPVLAALAASPAFRASGRVEVVANAAEIRAGQPITVGIRLIPNAGWHTYWVNPGDSGGPTTVEWHLPAGWVAKPIRWPTPDRIDLAGIVCYGYEGPTTLLQDLVPPAGGDHDKVELSGRVRWLTCTPQTCVPADADIKLNLPVSNPAWPGEMVKIEAKLPKPLRAPTVQARLQGKEIVLTVGGVVPMLTKPGALYFFPESPGMVSHSKAQEFSIGVSRVVGLLPVSEYAQKPPTRLEGVLKAPPGDDFAGQGSAVAIDVPIVTSKENKQ